MFRACVGIFQLAPQISIPLALHFSYAMLFSDTFNKKKKCKLMQVKIHLLHNSLSLLADCFTKQQQHLQDSVPSCWW